MKQSGRADLNHIRTFVWVARSGSFTRAAKALAMPKSTVSQHLRALEERLGTRLIQRTTRRLALTEIGELFLSHSERVIVEAEDAERAVTHYRSEPRGLLRVGVPVTFARTYLAPMLPGFCRKHPGIRVELIIPGRLDPVENSLDVVIRVGRIEDSSYVVKKLAEIPQRLFSSRRYLKARGSPESPAQLAGHSLIVISRKPQGARWKLVDRSGKETEVQFEPHLAVADPVIAHHLAAAGMGIAAVPEFLSRGDRKLTPVLPAWSLPPVELFALYPAREFTPPKLRVFLEELQGAFSSTKGSRRRA
jgi:DNA-binding transcriptional LysR family regulator